MSVALGVWLVCAACSVATVLGMGVPWEFAAVELVVLGVLFGFLAWRQRVEDAA